MRTLIEALGAVARPGYYGLISYDKQGNPKHWSYRKTNEGNPHEFFTAMGWVWTDGLGYCDSEGDRAETFINGESVNLT